MNEQELAQAWIRRYEIVQKHGDNSHEAKATFDDFERFTDAVRHDPERAWAAILIVVKSTNNEFVLENLAAGPLENLLVEHGDAFVDRIEYQAGNEQFRWLLRGVWGERVAPSIWVRIEQVVDP